MNKYNKFIRKAIIHTTEQYNRSILGAIFAHEEVQRQEATSTDGELALAYFAYSSGRAVEHSLAQEVERDTAVHIAFEQLELGKSALRST